jgi:hypothetical protein
MKVAISCPGYRHSGFFCLFILGWIPDEEKDILQKESYCKMVFSRLAPLVLALEMLASTK